LVLFALSLNFCIVVYCMVVVCAVSTLSLVLVGEA